MDIGKKVDYDVLYDFSETRESPVFLEGFLKKQGDAHKSWKKRWFELDFNAIHYYKNKKVKYNVNSLLLLT